MTVSKDAHDMKNYDGQISDEEIQLYLMGELQGPKEDLIRGIDVTSIELISSKRDRTIKEQIIRLRKVDKLLLDAAKSSYKMPSDLEQKISSTLAMRVSVQKKSSLNLFSWIKQKLKEADFTSLVSGGALAALSMFVILEIQPDLLVDPSQLRHSEITFRGTMATDGICNVENSTRWEVAESFAFSASLCEPGEKIVELTNAQQVSVGQKFVLHLVATNDAKISIEYMTEANKQRDVIFEAFMSKGETYKSDVFEFSLPLGKDQIEVISSTGDKLSIQFEVN